MLTYNPTTNKFIHQIQIPQNGVDNVDGVTVNPTFQALADDANYISYALRAYRPHVHLKWINNTTVALETFGPIAVSNSQLNPLWWQVELPSSVTLTNADLEGGGVFAADTAYYVYLTVLISGVSQSADIVISTSPPEASLTFKNVGGTPQFTHRYLGSFSTDTFLHIREFSMIDFKYMFPDRLLGTLTTGAAVLSATIDLTVPSPIVSSVVKSIAVKSNVTTSEFALSTLSLQAKGWTGTVTYAFSKAGAGANYFSYYQDQATGTGNQFTAILSNGGTAPTAGNIAADIYMIGYTE